MRSLWMARRSATGIAAYVDVSPGSAFGTLAAFAALALAPRTSFARRPEATFLAAAAAGRACGTAACLAAAMGAGLVLACLAAAAGAGLACLVCLVCLACLAGAAVAARAAGFVAFLAPVSATAGTARSNDSRTAAARLIPASGTLCASLAHRSGGTRTLRRRPQIIPRGRKRLFVLAPRGYRGGAAHHRPLVLVHVH